MDVIDLFKLGVKKDFKKMEGGQQEEEEETTREQQSQKLLIKLTRMVVKFFYQPKDLILVDFVIKEKYVTETRLEEVLKFDVKLIRVTVDALKNDRILSVKSEKELNSDGKTCKVNYYFIKYGQLVNVIKYKLENVRTRLETLERELSKTKSFICESCNKTWTDMEAGELFNQITLKFICRFCRKPVKEDTSEIPSDTRLMVSKFNEQVGPLYDALREVELHFQK